MKKTASKSETDILIPEIKTAFIQVRISGTTALICHRFSEESQQAIEARQQGEAKIKKPPRNPEQECAAACYRNTDGDYAFPASGIKRAIVTAGQRFAGEKSTELNGVLNIPQELIPIIGDSPRMRADRVVLSGPSRVSSIAYRPEFLHWAMVVPIAYVDNFISADQIINLLRIAGFSVGIGDWRVEKKGWAGQFIVDGVVG